MVNYFSLRSPKKVVYINTVENYNEVVVPVNQFLIEWTLENLFKNAIDAMEESALEKIIGIKQELYLWKKMEKESLLMFPTQERE